MRRAPVSLVILLVLGATISFTQPALGDLCLPSLKSQQMSGSSTTPSSQTNSQSLVCDTSTGGGGGSHTSSWTPSQNYTERNDTLQRFTNFPIASSANGLVNLTSLPYVAPRTFATGSLSGLTDAGIANAMSALGMTTQMLSDELANFYAGDTSQSNRVATAQQDVQSGAYLAAVNTIASADTNITLWCGDADNPTSYTWVVIIPAVLPCPAGGANRNFPVAAIVPDQPQYTVVIDANNNPWLVLSQLNLTLKQVTPTQASSPRITMGLQYLDLIWTSTTANKNQTIAVNVRNLEMTGGQANKEGWVYWNATSGSLLAGDNLTFTHANRFRQEKNVNVTLGKDVISFGARYGSQAFTDSWRVWLYYFSPDTVQNATLLVIPSAGHELQFTMANQTNGISFKSAPAMSMGRAQQSLTIASAGGAFVDTEVKATYFVNTVPVLDFQFKGMPGDDSVPGDTTFPSKNVLRLDFGGSGSSGNFTFDLSKGTRSTGYYRALVITSRVAAFPFLATAAHVDRVQYAGGAVDPWAGTQPFAIHSADTPQYESNSSFATSTGFAPAVTSTLFPTANSGTPPGSEDWSMGPSDTCSACSGTMARGGTHTTQATGVVGKFWAIQTSDDQLLETFCPFTYNNGGACV